MDCSNIEDRTLTRLGKRRAAAAESSSSPAAAGGQASTTGVDTRDSGDQAIALRHALLEELAHLSAELSRLEMLLHRQQEAAPGVRRAQARAALLAVLDDHADT